MKEKLRDPQFLMFECLIGLFILESPLPPVIFGLKWIGFLLVIHSAVTLLYLLLRGLQRRRGVQEGGKVNG